LQIQKDKQQQQRDEKKFGKYDMERKKKQVEAEAGHGTSDIQHKITDKELAKKIEENQSMFSRRL